jgi:hypothetical protein
MRVITQLFPSGTGPTSNAETDPNLANFVQLKLHEKLENSAYWENGR